MTKQSRPGERPARGSHAAEDTPESRTQADRTSGDSTREDQAEDTRRELARLRGRLQWYETHDALTGLMNLRTFRQVCAKALESGRFAGRSPVIVYFNIHHFSGFNAKYGYAAGDQLLQRFVGEMLRIFDTKLAARFSSDLFYLCTGRDGVQDRILELQEVLLGLRKESYLELQAGVYVLHEDEPDLSTACDLAKTAGSQVEPSGRVCFRFFDEKMDAQLRLHRYIVEHIDSAIEQGHIKVYYQPVVRSLTGELCGAEALARWQDPVYHLMPPGAFIEVLEKERLIYKLDVYVLRECCRLIHDRLEKGEPVVPLSFNVSRLDFELCDIYAELNKAVAQYKIPKEYINVEITERMMGNDAKRMEERIERFHADGYQVWMDDFGSEYSSLNALKDVYFDELKIDMGFLRDFSERSRKIITSVVEMAKRLGIQTLAEGVETREQFTFLQRIGCEKIQGYYFGWPMPPEELLAHLKERQVPFEPARLRHYYDQVGTVNVLNGIIVQRGRKAETSGVLLQDENATPLALIEQADGAFHYRYANEAYRRVLDSMGVYSMADAEDRLNKPQLAFSKVFSAMVHALEEKGGVQHMNYVQNDNYCSASAVLVAKTEDRLMIAGSVVNLSENTDLHRNEMLNGALRAMYTMYEEVLVASPADNQIHPVFIEKSRQDEETQGRHPLREYTDRVERTMVYPEDRERYRAYTESSTMVDRIKASGKTFVSDYFRLMDRNGSYTWKTIIGILLPDRRQNRVLICVRAAFPDEEQMDTLIAAIIESAAEAGRKLDTRVIRRLLPEKAAEGTLAYAGARAAKTDAGEDQDHVTPTAADLWKNLVLNTSLVGFWKDRNRRFLGVTQAFLDYYHLKSQDDVIGRTDEEMHYHVDPLPFHEDEDRVLEKGEHIYHQVGNCIIRGQQHEIMASKIPIYQHGRIVGLMGYALDVTGWQEKMQNAALLLEKDNLTGLVNLRGIMNSATHYADSYLTKRIDFILFYINIAGFRRLQKIYGQDITAQILAAVGHCLQDTVGDAAVVGRVSTDQFVILQQDYPGYDPAAVVEQIQTGVGRIHVVGGQAVTIYVRCGYARISESHNVETMLMQAAKMAGGNTLVAEDSGADSKE